jgi:hypothetical protein
MTVEMLAPPLFERYFVTVNFLTIMRKEAATNSMKRYLKK